MNSRNRLIKTCLAITLAVFVPNHFFAQENQQNRTISGVIKSDNGETLPGVNVVVSGTTTGVVSDNNGYYKIIVPQGNKYLEFSSIGYNMAKIEIQGRSMIDVILSTDVVNLSEIVIVAYGSTRKSDLTGSVTSINSKDYSHQPLTQVDQVLQGRTSGVQISNTSGVPGGDVKIRIRGANSILGDNNPLIIVDGISGVDLRSINVNDIESIQVLKDASSTAMYGSRGANGVVIISTKSGHGEKPLINFNSFASLSYLPKKIPYLNPADFATIKNEANKELGYLPVFSDEQIAELSKTNGTDWQNELFRTGFCQNLEFSVQGSSKAMNYFISGEAIHQDGILINTSDRRYDLRAKLESQIKKKLRIGTNISVNRGIGHNNDNIGNFQSSIGRLPTWPSIENVWDKTHSYYNNNPRFGPSSGNPVGIQQTVNSDWITNNLSCNGFASFSVTSDLEIKATGDINIKNANNNYFDNLPLLSGPGSQASAWILNQNSMRTLGNIIVTYTRDLGKSNLQATGIYEETSYKVESANAYGIDLSNAGYLYHNLALAGTPKASSDYYDEYLRSFAGRINYSLANKYLLTFTMRADGSSKFLGSNKWGFFPSAALGWRISEEPFIKNLNIFSTLKLRLSWGITGNQGIPSYGTLARMTSADQRINTSYPIDGPFSLPVTGFAIGSPGNAALKWESTDQKDLGIEMSFLNGKVSIEGDYYMKKTYDLLLPYTMPIFANSALVYKNSGSIQNKGVEVLVNLSLVNGNIIQWRTGCNVTVNRNKILDLGTHSDPFASSAIYGGGIGRLTILQEGQSLGTFYGYKYLGVWKTSEATEAAKYGLSPGDARFEDKNNDHLYNSFDEQVLGKAQPDFIFGMNNSITLFGNIEINLLIQGVKGGKIFNDQREKSLTQSQSRDFNGTDILRHWTPENENTNIPSLGNVVGIYNSSQWLEDASYTRLKNLSVAYSFPAPMLDKVKITNLQIYMSAQNLLTISKYRGYDPEASSATSASGGGSSRTDVDQNIDSGSYPNPKSYTIGLKLSF
jgi:TonB-dependent starch-binding outer membrane protein SusC